MAIRWRPIDQCKCEIDYIVTNGTFEAVGAQFCEAHAHYRDDVKRGYAAVMAENRIWNMTYGVAKTHGVEPDLSFEAQPDKTRRLVATFDAELPPGLLLQIHESVKVRTPLLLDAAGGSRAVLNLTSDIRLG